MHYLTLAQVLELHRRVIEPSGGAEGVRDMGAVESAVMQPQMSYGGQELYPTIAAKAAALCFALVMNHPFLDGNKRIRRPRKEQSPSSCLARLCIFAPLRRNDCRWLSLISRLLTLDSSLIPR